MTRRRQMTTFRFFGALAILSAFGAAPALAQPMIDEPGMYAFYHPNGDPNAGTTAPADAMALASDSWQRRDRDEDEKCEFARPTRGVDTLYVSRTRCGFFMPSPQSRDRTKHRTSLRPRLSSAPQGRCAASGVRATPPSSPVAHAAGRSRALRNPGRSRQCRGGWRGCGKNARTAPRRRRGGSRG